MQLCEDCGREAVAKVRRKYPSKNRTPRWVCGYHLRSYMTSEFHRDMVTKPEPVRKRTFGYAPDIGFATGYGDAYEDGDEE